MSEEVCNFLALSYAELERLNLNSKKEQEQGFHPETIREERIK